MPNDGKINKVPPIMIDSAGGSVGQALIVNAAGTGLEFGNVAASSSGGSSISTGGGGPVIINYGWSTNQDWDQVGVTKTNIQNPSVNNMLFTTELTGYFTDTYNNLDYISRQTDTQLNAIDGIMELEKVFDVGSGKDGDLILSGTTYSEYVGNCGRMFECPTGAETACQNLTLAWSGVAENLNSSSKYLNSMWPVLHFIGNDRVVLDTNDYGWNQAYFEDTVKVGDEYWIFCREMAQSRENTADILSVGRHEFVKIKAIDYNTRTITFTGPKKYTYGQGGNTDVGIGGSPYTATDRMDVVISHVNHFDNVKLGTTDPANTKKGVLRPYSYMANWLITGSQQRSNSPGIVGPIRVRDTLDLADGWIGFYTSYITGTHDAYYGGPNNYQARGINSYGSSNHYSRGGGTISADVRSGYSPNVGVLWPAHQNTGGGMFRSDYYGDVDATGGGNFTAGAGRVLGHPSYAYLSGGNAIGDIGVLDLDGTCMAGASALYNGEIMTGHWDDRKVFYGGAGGVATTLSYPSWVYGMGGGIIIIYANKVILNGDSFLQANGGTGTASSSYYAVGAGAGGTIILYCKEFINGSSVSPPIQARGNVAVAHGNHYGSAGGYGRVLLKYQTWSGATWSDTGQQHTQIPGLYTTSGTLTSTNVLSGKYVTKVDNADFYVSDIPLSTSVSAQFSQDGTTWNDSQGNTSQGDTLSGGANNIDLSTLNWTTSSYFYKLLFATTDTDFSAQVTTASVNYTPNLFEAAGIWESNTVSYGNFHLQPRTIKSMWSPDDDAPYPSYQLIGDNNTSFSSSSAVTLPAPGAYYKQGGVYSITNNTELDIQANSPFRQYWKVKASLGAGSDLTDTPSVANIYLTTTATVTPTANLVAGGWVDDGITVRLDTLTDKVGIGVSNPNTTLAVSGVASVSGTTATDNLRINSPSVPAASGSSGTTGDVAWDSNYMYMCVATNSWKRSPLSGW